MPFLDRRFAAARVVALLAVLPAFANTNGWASSSTVALDTTHLRYSFPPNFFGANGQQRIVDWNAGTFPTALGGLNLGLLRFPDGTGGNYWDWEAGQWLTIYGNPPWTSSNTAQFGELQKEIANSGALPVFVMNLLSDTQNTSHPIPAPQTVGGVTTYGPPQSYQLDYVNGMLTAAKNGSSYGLTAPLNLPYLELGNEFYFDGPNSWPSDEGTKGDNQYAYPDTSNYIAGASYGTTVSSWISTIRDGGGSYGNDAAGVPYQCAALAAPFGGALRQQYWKHGSNYPTASGGLFSTLTGEDAVTLHTYSDANLENLAQSGTPLNTVVSGTTITYAQELLAVPFLAATKLAVNMAGGSDPIQDGSGNPIPVWFTEYNLDQGSKAVNGKKMTIEFGTWAHGLTVAGMGLKWMEFPQVAMLIHHDVIDIACYGDLFVDDTAMQIVDGLSTSELPVQYGLSASGLTTRQVNLAAKGQSAAQELTFSVNSQITVPDNTDGSGNVTYPSLLGWEFSGGTNDQFVILNVGPSAQAVDLTGMMSTASGAQPTYTQVSGQPQAYVMDGANSTAMDYNGTSDNLSTASGNVTSSNIASFNLPAFSITRVASFPLSYLAINGATLGTTPTNTSGVWTVEGSGHGLANTNSGSTDQCACFCEPTWEVTGGSGGPMTAVALVQSVSGSSTTTAKAGVMIRQSTSSDTCPEATVSLTEAGKVVFSFRPTAGAGTNNSSQATIGTGTPCWVKLVRDNSNNFTAWYSAGAAAPTTWTQLGSSENIPMGGDIVEIGLVATADDSANSQLCTGTFASVHFTSQ